jgi:hypothetical protein
MRAFCDDITSTTNTSKSNRHHCVINREFGRRCSPKKARQRMKNTKEKKKRII